MKTNRERKWDLRGATWALAFGLVLPAAAQSDVAVEIPDANLEFTLREVLEKPVGAITRADMETIKSLYNTDPDISDLTGLETAVNLEDLYLRGNQITDVSPLAGLVKLEGLTLSGNRIEDIQPLAGLNQLTRLELGFNEISDIAPLTNQTELAQLELSGNQIVDISPLESLTKLEELHVDDNQIQDLSSLSNLVNVTWLWLSNNQICDITPLLEMDGLKNQSIWGHTIPGLVLDHNNLDTRPGTWTRQVIDLLEARENLTVAFEPQSWEDLAPGNPALVRSVSNNAQPVRFSYADDVWSVEWISEAVGDWVSVRFRESTSIDTEYVFGNPTFSPSAGSYRLLGSTNYRDWIILSEGLGAIEKADRFPATFDAFPAQFLRFESLSSDEMDWRLLAGTEATIESTLGLYQPVDWGEITDPEVIFSMLDLTFTWKVVNQTDKHEGLGWVTGAFHAGISALYQATGDPRYRQAISDRGASANWTLRDRGDPYHADDHSLGQTWLELFLLDPNPRDIWIQDVKNRIDWVMANPLSGREDYWWCDALFMSPPVYERLATITGDDAYRTFIDGQWWDCVDYLYDQERHLFYRDAGFFNDREANGEPVFWSRGNGWVMAGAARMLQYMPDDWPTRPQYENLLEEMASALAAIQDPFTGLWTSSLLYPGRFNYEPETSGSAFFTFAMAYGVIEGILDSSTYGPVIEKAWDGLSSMLSSTGTLRYIQQGGAGPAANNMELLWKDFGYGAFLLAGVEMARYYADFPRARTFSAFARTGLDTVPIAALGDPSHWQLVADFEAGVNWTLSTDSVPDELMAGDDPFADTANQVLQFSSDMPSRQLARAALPAITAGQVATIYQRFAVGMDNELVEFGFSDEPSGQAHTKIANGFRIGFYNNLLEVKSNNVVVARSDDFLQLGTWYEVWTVIDQPSGLFDVYLRGGSNYPEMTQMAAGLPFREGEASDIVTYRISSLGRSGTTTHFCLDDLHLDPTSLNLTRPEGVPQPAYSPWSEIGGDRTFGHKHTPLGVIEDDAFPWIYHSQLGFIYIAPQEPYGGGYYGWVAAMNIWLYAHEPSLDASGTWCYLFKRADAHTIAVEGEDEWGGYPVVSNPDASRWVDTRDNWLGYLSVGTGNYHFVHGHGGTLGSSNVWIYMTEPASEANGVWAYVFKGP